MPREIAHCKVSLGILSLAFFSPSWCKYLKLLWNKLCFLVETPVCFSYSGICTVQEKKKWFCTGCKLQQQRHVLSMHMILSNIWSKIFEDLCWLTSVLDSVDFNCMGERKKKFNIQNITCICRRLYRFWMKVNKCFCSVQKHSTL